MRRFASFCGSLLLDAHRPANESGEVFSADGSVPGPDPAVCDHSGGVPDEPGHLDTAYKYSNKILFVEDTGNPGTIYKRRCDVEMSDMLANGLESNSYFQLMTDTFHRAEDTELMEVGYVDSTNLVPGIVYIPSALGISLGRILGLSAMFTLQMARVFNLICFVLLAWAAVRMIPFGKNVLAMTALASHHPAAGSLRFIRRSGERSPDGFSRAVLPHGS